MLRRIFLALLLCSLFAVAGSGCRLKSKGLHVEPAEGAPVFGPRGQEVPSPRPARGWANAAPWGGQEGTIGMGSLLGSSLGVLSTLGASAVGVQ